MTNEINYSSCEDDIEYDLHSKYCTYACEESPDTIAFNGRCIIYIKADDFFATNGYTSPILNNPTYMDIFNLLDDIVETTGDYHHIFFEGIHYVKQINEHIHQIDIVMGS